MTRQLAIAGAKGSCTVVKIYGEVDLAEAPTLGLVLRSALRSGARRAVVDMADLDFIDAAGLGVLVEYFNLFKEAGGELRLVATNTEVLLAFEITELTGVVPIFGSLDAAIA